MLCPLEASQQRSSTRSLWGSNEYPARLCSGQPIHMVGCFDWYKLGITHFVASIGQVHSFWHPTADPTGTPSSVLCSPSPLHQGLMMIACPFVLLQVALCFLCPTPHCHLAPRLALHSLFHPMPRSLWPLSLPFAYNRILHYVFQWPSSLRLWALHLLPLPLDPTLALFVHWVELWSLECAYRRCSSRETSCWKQMVAAPNFLSSSVL